MKFTAPEEYGLRCLLRLGQQPEGASLTIPEISRLEGISPDYVAKLMRVLRRGSLVRSLRGQAGGYALARPAAEINIAEALAVLGGRLFDPSFCDRFAGEELVCTHSIDCSLRSLWRTVQFAVDRILTRTTLRDLLGAEREFGERAILLVAGPAASKPPVTQ